MAMLSLALPVCASAQETPSPQENEAYAIGLTAFIYGYPMIVSEAARTGMTATAKIDGVRFKAPRGIWAHATELAGPEMEDIQSTNNDTIYSWIWADLAEEPYIYVKPDTGGRFYTTQIIDAFTNNFAYVSQRTHGNGEQTIALVGPDWTGKLPAGMEVIEAPTNTVFVIQRLGVDGEADMPEIRVLQSASSLLPLSHHLVGTIPAMPEPEEKATYQGPLAAFEQIGNLLALNHPPPYEAGLIGMFSRIGLSPDYGFVEKSLTDEQRAGLARAAADGMKAIEAAATSIGREVNGWQLPPVAEEFFGTDYMLRAVIAWQSVYQNTPVEAYYPALFNDSDGNALDGATGKYVLRFEGGALPRVDAFWSITLYDLERRLMVPNPIKRYSIGDRTDGIVFGEDGSLEITLQSEDPGGAASANWLPAPKAPFYLLMRAYRPQSAMLDGTYALPPVQKKK